MVRKFIRWLIFGDSILELRPEAKWRYFLRNGKPYKELVRGKE